MIGEEPESLSHLRDSCCLHVAPPTAYDGGMKSIVALLALALLLHAGPLAAQVTVVQPVKSTPVWTYSFPGTACIATDYSDVPARPFLVGPGNTVLWFASNSSGSFASVGVSSSPDMLASLQRGTAAGAGCVSWLPATNYPGSVPGSYNTGLWMVAPFTPDGINIQALVHNEFHGEWASRWFCWLMSQSIYLPCNYWNIVSASSTDGGNSFNPRLGLNAGNLMPAIALGQPYQRPDAPQASPANQPQGITAQSNILEINGSYYVLVQQLPYQPPAPAPPVAKSGVCLYRAAIPAQPTQPLVWLGWGPNSNGQGYGYNVAVPTSYPANAALPLCQPVLGVPFRFSWSFNKTLNQLIIIGQDTLSAMAGKKISTEGCPSAPGVTTPDSAFVYMTATLSAAGQLGTVTSETCLLLINSIGNWAANLSPTGQAYPSLLDPASPTLTAGDRNFQYSGAQPYLYYTQLNAKAAGNGNDRDLVRVPLAVAP